MPWLKVGDTAATHPVVLRASDDELMQNAVYGFVQRCATFSARHLTDYFVSASSAALFGGKYTETLSEQAEQAGYWSRAERDGELGWLLIDDPTFFEIKLKAQHEWETQRRRDARNTDVTVPVRLRDGDRCRYCRRLVGWRNRVGGAGGTYDHLVPQEQSTAATCVVSCRSCNSSLKDLPRAEREAKLLPPPTRPVYGKDTVELLSSRGVTVELTPPDQTLLTVDPPSGTAQHPAGGRAQAAGPTTGSPLPAPRGARPAGTQPGDGRQSHLPPPPDAVGAGAEAGAQPPPTGPPPAAVGIGDDTESSSPARELDLDLPARAGREGTGLVGDGRAGSGLARSGPAPGPPAARASPPPVPSLLLPCRSCARQTDHRPLPDGRSAGCSLCGRRQALPSPATASRGRSRRGRPRGAARRPKDGDR